jgi:hypothetical protein
VLGSEGLRCIVVNGCEVVLGPLDEVLKLDVVQVLKFRGADVELVNLRMLYTESVIDKNDNRMQ